MYKEDKPVVVVSVGIAGIIALAVVLTTYFNRNRPHIPKPEELFTRECIKRGGEPKMRAQYEDNVSLQDFECRDEKRN